MQGEHLQSCTPAIGVKCKPASAALSLHAGQLGEPDSQTSSSHVNAHSALERSRESAKTVDLIVKVTGDFSVQLFWTDFEGEQEVHAVPQGRPWKWSACPFCHGDAALLTDKVSSTIMQR